MRNLFLKSTSSIILFLIFSVDIFSQTFNYTGAAQTWTVPSCVTTITVTVEGAQGGGPNGGLGAVVTATLAVTPGQVLQINVGGQGGAPTAGWNGGGAGQTASSVPDYSFGGGGASDIRIAPNGLANRLIVAGGGGGTSGGDIDQLGGNGDCNTGGNGSSTFGGEGFGGTQTAGGAGGPPWGPSASPGANGALGIGGAGGADNQYNLGPGGGGGGGYYGGGGGGGDDWPSYPLGGGGGGGGSSLVPAGGSCVGATNTGNGQITITTGIGGLTTNVTAVNPNCNGGTGSATVTTVGGTPAFTYAWSPSGGNSSAATGLSAGTYTVSVTDGTGCTATNTVTITVPTAITPSVVSTTTVNCGANNGTATVSGSGGTGAINYSWNTTPPQTGPTASNLGAGNYVVTLTDANGCTATQSVTITGSGSYSVTPSQTDVTCFGNNNGSATVTTSGGVAPFTYLWSTNPVQTTPTISNIPAGNYTCVITDATGCVQTSIFTITQPSAVAVSITNSTNANCFGSNDGTATASATGGNGPYNYSWSTSPTQAGATVTNLAAGTYIVTATDVNGCTFPQTVTITEPSQISLTTASTTAQCGIPDGTVSVTATGGNSPYSFLWLTTPTQNGQTATGLNGGTYNVIVTDINGCVSTQNVVVAQDPYPIANFISSSDTIDLLDPTATFYDNSTSATSWLWDFGDVNNPATSTLQNPWHMYSDSGYYCTTLIVTDAGGVCVDTAIKCLIVVAPYTFYVPNAFTPNADGYNDIFLSYGTYIKEFEMLIFDRWGNQVFKSIDYKKGWDGKVNGKGEMSPQDIYVWKVNVKDVYNKSHKYVGHVSLIRQFSEK